MSSDNLSDATFGNENNSLTLTTVKWGGPGPILSNPGSTLLTFDDGRVTASIVSDTHVAAGDVEDPTVTALSDNGYVVAWTHDVQGASAIVIKRYSGDGELLQRTEVASDGIDDPSITALPDGQFILAWTSQNEQTGASSVHTQLFAADGSKSGNSVVVTSVSGHSLEDAKVTLLTDNSYIVTWGETYAGNPDTADLKAVVYTNGKAGVEQALLAGNAADGEADDMAVFNGAGDTHWLTYTVQTTSDDGLNIVTTRLQVVQISADGKPLAGTAQTIGEVVANLGNDASYGVTQLTNGNYLVSWVDNSAFSPNENVLHTQQFTAQFQPIGEAQEIYNGSTTMAVSAHALPDGGYVLVWIDAYQSGNVLMQRYDAAGVETSPLISTVHPSTEGETYVGVPEITVRNDGTTVITWQVMTESGMQVHLQKVDANGILLNYSYALAGDDQDNTLHWAGTADVVLDGGAGTDTAQLDGNLAEHTFANDSEGNITVKGQQVTSLVDIEKIKLADGTITLETNRFANESGGAVVSMEPASTPLADGGYVITWEQGGQIYLQHYDQANDLGFNGVIVGASGHNPVVTADPAGGFVVGWVPDDQYTLVLQAFGADGQPSGAQVIVERQDDNSSVRIEDAAITVLANGKWAVTWSEELNVSWQDASGSWHFQEGGELFVQFYDPVTHTLLGEPGKIDNTVKDNAVYANEPSVANLQNGGFVVVWERELDASDKVDVYLQRYDANGKAVGGNVKVSTSGQASYGAEVAVLQDGSYVVTWTSVDYAKGSDEVPVSGDVFMQRYSASGAKLGSVTQVNGDSSEIPGEPAITALKGGGYVITWATSDEAPHAGQPSNLYLQVYDKNGAKIGNQQAITSDWDNDLFPVVSATADGGFIITWEALSPERVPSTGENVAGDIYSQRFDANGNSTTLVGDGGDNTIAWTGSSGVILRGGEGDDTLTGGASNDTLDGGEGNDHLNGGAGAGADVLIGGAGNDTYVVDNLGDLVVENADEGTDTVFASVSHTLATNVENLTLTGSAALNGTGNDGANILIGNSGKNTLTGGKGNDVLDGGAGVDTLVGGADDDTYIVDLRVMGVGAKSTLALEDTVVEKAGEGSDTLMLRVSSETASAFTSTGATGTVTLAANLENLDASLAGSIRLNLNGNAVGNRLVGNEGNNILDGKAGVDILVGGKGDDTYVLDDARELDLLVENTNEGNDTLQITWRNTAKVAQAIDLTQASLANIENVSLIGTGLFDVTGNAQDNKLTGNASRNILDGGAGNDTLDGKGGGDRLIGGEGDDHYYVYSDKDELLENVDEGTDTVHVVAYAKNSYTLQDNFENAVAEGAAAINLTGNAADNTLTGNAGANILDGGAGADTLVGGKGNDTYIVDDVGDVVVELANEGIDTVKSSVSAYTLGDNVENLILLDGAITGVGNDLSNTITGNGGSNVLIGGKGVDTLIGGAGSDLYGVDLIMKGTGSKATLVLEDTVVEKAGGGEMDAILASLDADVQAAFAATGATATITLGANIEGLALDPNTTAKINLVGNAAANVLTGNAGDNLLDGKGGVDYMSGGLGNDTYVLDNQQELLTVTELEGEGVDTLQITYRNTGTTAMNIDISETSTIANVNIANFENVTVSGAGLFNLKGNDRDNLLTGNASRNVIEGGAGNDTLDGKGGGDQLIGGEGDDHYYVYSDKDQLVENAGEGIDTVHVVAYAKSSYTLQDNFENAVAEGTAAISLTGNAEANTLTGNAGANILDGGLGADTLAGGKGNDTYIVDNVGDRVIEAENEGTDTVKASIDYTLTDNVENLVLLGDAVQGTGNGLKNAITGTNGNNILDGKGGIDTLTGGDGDDTYIVDLLIKGAGVKAAVALEDIIVETAKAGSGIDTLQLRMDDAAISSFQGSASITLGANLENLDARNLDGLVINLTGNAANNEIWGSNAGGTLNGGAGNDILRAGDAGNVLIGGLGADTLHGGAGADIFKFNALTEMGLGDKQDVIVGFGAGDKIDLSALKGYSFIGQASDFTGLAKQLRFEADSDGNLTLFGTSNADNKADFSIKLVGVSDLTADQLTLA
ncbi:beta strand repeat-containing protein [Pseudomonas sp. NPDC089406]|uniref:beta strand repeat-containing protein n=1 Tax=Pseudomonas sp. NPDC089406 TaxID=3364463 RepID=UPI00384F2A19